MSHKWNQQKLVITCSNGTLKPIYKENKTWTTGKLICGKLAVATWMHDHESVRLNPRGKQHGARKFPKVTNQCTAVGWQNNPFNGKIMEKVEHKFTVQHKFQASSQSCWKENSPSLSALFQENLLSGYSNLQMLMILANLLITSCDQEKKMIHNYLAWVQKVDTISRINHC